MTDKRYIKMVARYDGRCVECEEEILEGDQIVWDSAERRTYCEACGEDLED